MDDTIGSLLRGVNGDSREAVAYALLTMIAVAEGKVHADLKSQITADASWILGTYSRCLRVVSGQAP